MSIDDAYNRMGPEAETQAGQGEQVGFQIPAELRKRYDVRLVPGDDGSDRRIGLFLSRDRGDPSIEISGNGDRIVAHRQDPETVAALITIARHNGWEGIEVDGSPEFRKAVWAAGVREGLTVRGYEPTYAELEKMAALRREESDRPQRETAASASLAEQTPAKAKEDSPGRVADAEPNGELAGGYDVARDFSPGDERLLLMLSAYTKDRETLAENVRDDMSPMAKEVQFERLAANRAALDGALDRVLESPTLVSAFAKAGYEPDDLRKASAADERKSELAEAIHFIRYGLNRQDVEREMRASFVEADREYRLDTAVMAGRQLQPAPQIPDVRERDEHRDTKRSHDSDELAELFLHGAADRIASEPRLANALEAQATMERHLAEVFDGDIWQSTAGALESRQLISDVLRRGLDVSVREPTPARQIEPPQITPDLER